MKTAATPAILLVAAVLLWDCGDAKSSYQARIPNGNRVPSPCQNGTTLWPGVGHQSSAGSNARNQFGLDFAAAGNVWTPDLCRKDSDGDGLTNGQELGDPDCIWTPGATPARTTGLSHPGICPLDSRICKNSWDVCPKVFNCPAMNEVNVTVRNFTINNNTAVPAKETTYICQAFELNSTATPVHMIGSRPIIVNKNVMHHMIMYACESRPEQAMFDGPQECFMGHKNCTEILNLWAFGIDGECFNPNAGFRIGGEGYRYAILELHWNNPTLQSTYRDSSGFSLFFTPNLRMYDQGTVMYGEGNLVLPPRQPLINFNHTCPSACTNAYHTETRYITSATIHMHTFGIQGRISLWRNGTLLKDLSPLQVYDYNSPRMNMFDTPIEYRPGDEVKTECYFTTLRSNRSIFFGESTSDEMCLSFLSYYPNRFNTTARDKLARCVAASGINICYLQRNMTPQVEQDCNISGMLSGVIPGQVMAQMTNNLCFSRTGCDPKCRDYLNNTLWPNNACYDPKRARQMAEVLATGNLRNPSAPTISATLYGQRFCEQEIRMLADYDRMMASAGMTTPAMMATGTAMPAGAPGNRPLTSEHLLIIIIVCSCLGVVLVLAVLALLASKLPRAGVKAAPKAALGGSHNAGFSDLNATSNNDAAVYEVTNDYQNYESQKTPL